MVVEEEDCTFTRTLVKRTELDLQHSNTLLPVEAQRHALDCGQYRKNRGGNSPSWVHPGVAVNWTPKDAGLAIIHRVIF